MPGRKPAPARPPASAKVLGCFKTGGRVQPKGVRGMRRTSPTVAESSQVFGGYPSSGKGAARSRANRLTRPPVLNWFKDTLSFIDLNPSACGPVVRVSDEGGFGRARPLGRAQPVSRVSGKTDRSRGSDEIANSDKTLANKGRFQISTPPHVGKGVGIP